ncbi:MAG: stage III sporulation protein AF [Firmicutes bacterium]|nr:stage III sporulation protein AF [Bacillota bacterium]
MDVLAAWTHRLVVLVLALVVLDLLLPEGDLRRYVRLSFGVVLIGVVVGPVLSFLGRDWPAMVQAGRDLTAWISSPSQPGAGPAPLGEPAVLPPARSEGAAAVVARQVEQLYTWRVARMVERWLGVVDGRWVPWVEAEAGSDGELQAVRVHLMPRQGTIPLAETFPAATGRSTPPTGPGAPGPSSGPQIAPVAPAGLGPAGAIRPVYPVRIGTIGPGTDRMQERKTRPPAGAGAAQATPQIPDSVVRRVRQDVARWLGISEQRVHVDGSAGL